MARISLCTCAIGCWLALLQPAWGAPEAADETGLAEVVVTARKRTEVGRDVPISVAVVSAADLTNSKITQVADLATVTPALTITAQGTFPFAEIRGFGTGNDLSFDQAVGKFIDNVSYGRDQDLRLPLFDIERVEVLKGPQVLLYGNSSTAGALNITTKKPGHTLEADASGSYEFNAQQLSTAGGITLPIGEIASIRFAGMYDRLDEGYTFNALSGLHVPTQDNSAGRAILRLTPIEGLDILIKAEYDHIRQQGDASETVAQPTAGPPVFSETRFDGVTETDNNRAPFFQRDAQSVDNKTYQLDVNYEALGGIFTATSAYRDMQFGGSTPGPFPVPAFNAFLGYGYTQTSEELRYFGTFGSLDLTAGTFYQHENLTAYEALDTNLGALGAPLPPFAFNFELGEHTNSVSGFADLTYHFSPALSLAAGARYSSTSRDADQSSFPGVIVPNKSIANGSAIFAPVPELAPLYEAFFGVSPHDFQGLHLHESFTQPQVIAQYKFPQKAQVYAKYVKGDKAGGFDINYQGVPGNVLPQGARFEPEQAESYELGLKGIAFQDTLRYALAAFNTTFTNLQTNAFVGQATVAVVTNVGKARTRGLEAEVNFAPIAGLQFSSSATYAEATYLDFPGGACTRAQQAAQPVGCQQDLSGTSTPFSSRLAATLGGSYDLNIGEYVLSAGLMGIGRTGYNPSPNNEQLLQQHGYAQLDAHVDFKPARGHWVVSFFGRDLNDVHYIEVGGTAPLTTGGLFAYRSRGRQLGIRIGGQY